MAICFFGAYDPFYPRTAILRRGLQLNAQIPSELRLPLGLKAWARYPLGLSRALLNRNCQRPGTHLFVPAFGQKDVFLAFLLAQLFSLRLIFDPLASRYETKILDWLRKSPRSLSARWNRFLDKWSLQLADLVLADTVAHKNYYCQEFGLKAEKVAVLPVGFDDSIWRPMKFLGQQQKPFTVIFFGSFLPLHGAEQIVQAALKLEAKEPFIRFLFVGSGQTYPRVKKLIEEAGGKGIFLLGWMNQKDLVSLVNSEADLCLGLFGQTPKASRVVPHKIFQAMALGKPVLTLDTPAAREFFKDKINIYFCPSSKPEDIAQAIIELRYNEKIRLRIAQEGQNLVWQKYTPLALGRELLSILEKKPIRGDCDG